MANAATFNLADLFEIVADAVPEREALVAGDVRLTYRQLDERSNKLAHALAAGGVDAGDHVAIYAWNRAELEAHSADYDLQALTTFGSGGAMLSPSVKARIQDQLPSVRVSDGYGSSETGAGSRRVPA